MPLPSVLAAAALAAVALSGCVVAPLGSPVVAYPGDPYGGGFVSVPPPPPRHEAIGVAPVYGQIWIGGYWNWVGGRHVWVDGHWAAPRRGQAWVPHRWDRVGPGWKLKPGYWQRPR